MIMTIFWYATRTFKATSTDDWSTSAEIFYPITSQDNYVDPGPDSWSASSSFGSNYTQEDIVEKVQVAKVGNFALSLIERKNWHRKHHSLQVIMFSKVITVYCHSQT